ncbi:MAG: hypothetical protein M3Q58_03375 [Bacteroidota bacterium]|nr:hypothetical protein [Bacteroidota bacterium]
MEKIIITPKSKKSVAFLTQLLKGLSEEVENIQIVTPPKGRIAKSIDKGLKEAKEIMSGKIKAKTLDELLNED